ncbi:hypothetical protein TTHERM_000455538 (macronuclear) [Tetrahymena thermophila SB210]|uniref:Uncharacterized protein n=1 Tax=Tetrahymena thermophila (strain SB210) TaxID=312017 RepID=W7XDP9_TETTS|nr:hypothetical protein TTHERM_000455538 [Tetrahymena thermophila SB210]EWS71971.1 hypothetical protein TTHERM_000455538 [Tetrahymena thermophila SB210]|eukprot:XP_012655471.1 hypothetical protein TTHERM_000455538 [Tetrahymena thermophila SB210]
MNCQSQCCFQINQPSFRGSSISISFNPTSFQLHQQKPLTIHSRQTSRCLQIANRIDIEVSFNDELIYNSQQRVKNSL